MKSRVAVLDLGVGNIFSVLTALQRAGAEPYVVRAAADARAASALVFPGVANFGYVVEGLDRFQLRGPLVELIAGGMPYLGLCAGFQILFQSSEESPGSRGLGVLSGTVLRLRGPKTPHMGWNRCEVVAPNELLESGWAYFANSFAPPPTAPHCVATTEYGGEFAAACVSDHVTGVQFHPEKSGSYGAALLGRWLRTLGALQHAG